MNPPTAKAPTKKPVARAKAPKRPRGGVVRALIRPESETGRSHRPSSVELIALLRAGLPVEELDELQKSLGVPLSVLAELLGVSKATLHRRRAGQLLGPSESDHVVRFARLMGRAVEVFGSEEYARLWLSAPQFGLGGEIPLDFACTEVGAREVEDLMGRIRYSVYS